MTRWLRALLACALLVGLAGTAEAVTRGGTLTYARYADSLFLDPVFNDANVDIWILTNLYDTLLQPTADGTGVEPGLAAEYQMSDDGLSMTLKLRPNIKFSDGSPITVNDVKWSLDRARDPNNGIWNFTLASVDKIETQGEDTIVLRL
jgi:peptide/nickel transport system substrate-binding protein